MLKPLLYLFAALIVYGLAPLMLAYAFLMW